MLSSLFRKLVNLSPKLSEILWKAFYDIAAYFFKRKTNWKFMNYGYAQPNQESISYDNLCKQLYGHLLHQIKINKTSTIVEVGCGRGGGCEYMLEYNPKNIIGLDFSSKAINFCKANYSYNNLDFLAGNAENLFLQDNSIDVLINVESSHCYGDRLKFFAEVYRCLKPGAYFLYADFMSTKHYHKRPIQLQGIGFKIITQQDITHEVLRSMDLSVAYKMSLLSKIPFEFLRRPLVDFVGLPESNIYKNFQSKESTYFSFVCQKP